jgi:hypothetical protein
VLILFNVVATSFLRVLQVRGGAASVGLKVRPQDRLAATVKRLAIALDRLVSHGAPFLVLL